MQIVTALTSVIVKLAETFTTTIQAVNNLASATEKVTRTADKGAELYLDEVTHDLDMQRAKFQSKLAQAKANNSATEKPVL